MTEKCKNCGDPVGLCPSYCSQRCWEVLAFKRGARIQELEMLKDCTDEKNAAIHLVIDKLAHILDTGMQPGQFGGEKLQGFATRLLDLHKLLADAPRAGDREPTDQNAEPWRIIHELRRCFIGAPRAFHRTGPTIVDQYSISSTNLGWLLDQASLSIAPVKMRICCEGCGELHIDEGEFREKPHHTHSCQHCGLTFRNAIGPTVGVRFLPGFKNSEPAT